VPAVYEEPSGLPVVLHVPPRLASWDAKGHPSQVALASYLDALEAGLGPLPAASRGRRAVKLSVGLGSLPLTTGGRDLDNYAYPVAARLGAASIAAMFVEKHPGSASSIVVGDAVAADPPGESWSHATITTSASAASAAWKHEVASQVPQTTPGTDAVEVHLAFTVSAARNWSNLWKPAIDSLGGILGVDDLRHPFRPRDDRITRLGLHRFHDERSGWSVRLDVWWRDA